MAETRWWNEPAPEKPQGQAPVLGPPKTNQYGAIALICAIVGVVIPVPLVMVGMLVSALVFGVMGLDYSHRKGAPGGMATAAVIIAVVGAFLVTYMITTS